MDIEKNNLIIAAQKNDNNALKNLIKLEQKNIYAMLYYLNNGEIDDLNDVVQDVLLKLSKNIKQLKNPNNFKIWLNQIVINTFYDYLRKKKKQLNTLALDNILDDFEFNIPDNSQNPQNSILLSEMDFIIKSSINNLPLVYKLPITLREIQGLSYDEISNITKSSLGTVKSRIARARALIKKDIEKYEGIYYE